MDFGFMDGLAWRDLVLAAAAIIGVYLVLSLLRLFKVAAKRPADLRQQGGRDEVFGWEPYVPSEAQPAPQEAREPALAEPDFARELARSSIEGEVERLRRESAHLRAEVARLADEVTQLRATRNVSPLYNEAMVLAQQGMAAQGIAGRCGISIGEAELVAAMARSASAIDRHELGEEHDERNTDSGNRFHG